jgi:predicted nucleotidyltransferase
MDSQAVLKRLSDNCEEIRQRFSVKTLAVFGSVARQDTAETGDVDVLVAFDRKADFDTFMDLKFYLEDLLGTTIDLVTEKALRPQVRQAIEKQSIRVA